jgi:hypothetical protein
MRRALAASGRTHRVDQRSEHLAILARAMDLAERAHRMVEIGEPRLDVVEAAAAVQLGAQCVARIVDASRRAVLDVERAGMGTAERAACVGIGTRRRAQVSGPRAGAGERSELLIVEQVGGRARATSAAGERADRPRLAGRARSARRHLAGRSIGTNMPYASIRRRRGLGPDYSIDGVDGGATALVASFAW